MRNYLYGFFIVIWLQSAVWSQSVIINEVSQGSGGGKEWVELLVVDDNVDLRGWELGDNDDGTWHPIAEFNTHAGFSSIVRGTIIVIYNSGDIDATITAAGGEDTTFNDKSVLLGVDNTSFLTDTGPWGATAGAFANSDGDDAPAIRNASDEIIHDLAVTHPAATVSTPGLAEVKYYTGNTVAGIVDDSQWTVTSSSSATPGAANGGDNSSWVDQSLPVELSAWYAASSHGIVKLNWTTESEIENQGFIIERALVRHAGLDGQGEVWSEISSFVTNQDLLGHGSTTWQNRYSFYDRHVMVGETYSYRLSDVDYHGGVTHHKEISVTIVDDPDQERFTIKPYPNPSNSSINILLDHTPNYQPLRVDILNLRGEFVKNIFQGIPVTDRVHIIWDGKDLVNMQVPSGVYIAEISGSELTRFKTFTIIQ